MYFFIVQVRSPGSFAGAIDSDDDDAVGFGAGYGGGPGRRGRQNGRGFREAASNIVAKVLSGACAEGLAYSFRDGQELNSSHRRPPFLPPRVCMCVFRKSKRSACFGGRVQFGDFGYRRQGVHGCFIAFWNAPKRVFGVTCMIYVVLRWGSQIRNVVIFC